MFCSIHSDVVELSGQKVKSLRTISFFYRVSQKGLVTRLQYRIK